MSGHHLEQVIGAWMVCIGGFGSLMYWTVRRFTKRADLIDQHLTSFDAYLRSAHDCTDVKR